MISWIIRVIFKGIKIQVKKLCDQVKGLYWIILLMSISFSFFFFYMFILKIMMKSLKSCDVNREFWQAVEIL